MSEPYYEGVRPNWDDTWTIREWTRYGKMQQCLERIYYVRAATRKEARAKAREPKWSPNITKITVNRW